MFRINANVQNWKFVKPCGEQLKDLLSVDFRVYQHIISNAILKVFKDFHQTKAYQLMHHSEARYIVYLRSRTFM
jgi:hypothetical protein